MVHACVRTDNMSGTTLGKYLASVKFYDAENKEAAIDNGNVVLVGAYLDGEREVKKATAVAENSDLKNVVLVASEEVVKTKSKNNLDEFVNEAGAIARGYHFVTKDVFGVTKEAFASGSDLEVGSKVFLAAGTKMKAGADAGSATVVGSIVEYDGYWYVVEVA